MLHSSRRASHKRGPSITFADLDYDDKIRTISRRKQGKTTIVLGQYQLREKVGKGAFGIVYKALEFDTGNFVAIKRLKKEGIDENMLRNLKTEIELLKTLNHPHIVKYIALVDSDNHINMVLEFVESGSLLQIIQKYGVFPESLAALYTGQVLEGLHYLHNMNVIHRDIKASNILITKEGVVKLADFGIAVSADSPNNNAPSDSSSFVEGSPFWMAPEVIQLETPTTACDIWSLGCTIIELITGAPPYFDMPAMSALFRIVQEDRPPIPNNLTNELSDFLKLCFRKDPQARPSAPELSNHSWTANPSKFGLESGEMMSLQNAQSTIRIHNLDKLGDITAELRGSDSGSSSGSSRGSERSRGSLSSIDWSGDSSDRDSSGSDVPESGSSSRSSGLSKSPSMMRVQDIAHRFEEVNFKESVSYVVLITGFETRKNKMFSYTVFRLKVCIGKESWRIYKTYTDFKDLHTHLRARFAKTKTKVKLPKFPGTKMFGSEKNAFVKKRKRKLQTYITALLQNAEAMKTGLVIEFLKTDGRDASSKHQGSESDEEKVAVSPPSARGKRSSLREKSRIVSKMNVTGLEWVMEEDNERRV